MFSLFRRRNRAAADKPFEAPSSAHTPWQSEQQGELAALPRMLAHIIPRQPFTDWARKNGSDKSLAQMRHTESMAYLIPTETWETAEAEEFIEDHWPHFFAQALEGWNPRETHWPHKRTLELFNQWFEVRYSEMVLDLGGYTA